MFTSEPTMNLRWREATDREWNEGNFVMGTRTYFEDHSYYILEQMFKVTHEGGVRFEWHPVLSE